MKITAKDMQSLRYAIFCLDELKKIADTQERKDLVEKHIQRIRKMHLMLITAKNQPQLEFSVFVHAGIPEDCDLARSIRNLCPDL
ncbi:MAG TPA: hypothetical protein HPP51_05200 [Planctomycetes bacterium]|nr:hypothetical protein [Planctomycetota bacterium]